MRRSVGHTLLPCPPPELPRLSPHSTSRDCPCPPMFSWPVAMLKPAADSGWGRGWGRVAKKLEKTNFPWDVKKEWQEWNQVDRRHQHPKVFYYMDLKKRCQAAALSMGVKGPVKAWPVGEAREGAKARGQVGGTEPLLEVKSQDSQVGLSQEGGSALPH